MRTYSNISPLLCRSIRYIHRCRLAQRRGESKKRMWNSTRWEMTTSDGHEETKEALSGWVQEASPALLLASLLQPTMLPEQWPTSTLPWMLMLNARIEQKKKTPKYIYRNEYPLFDIGKRFNCQNFNCFNLSLLRLGDACVPAPMVLSSAVRVFPQFHSRRLRLFFLFVRAIHPLDFYMFFMFWHRRHTMANVQPQAIAQTGNASGENRPQQQQIQKKTEEEELWWKWWAKKKNDRALRIIASARIYVKEACHTPPNAESTHECQQAEPATYEIKKNLAVPLTWKYL